MKRNFWGWVVGIVVLLWITAVYAGYYGIHKPVSAGMLPPIAAELARLAQPWSIHAVVDAVLNLGAALWLGFVAYGVGRFLLRLVHLDLTWLERSLLSASLGLGVVSLGTFFLGMAGLLYPWVFYVLMIAATTIIAALWSEKGPPGYPHPNPLRAQRAPGKERGQDRRRSGFFILGGTQTGVEDSIGVEGRGWRGLRLPRLSTLHPRPSTLALGAFVVLTEALALVSALTPPWAWDSLVYHLTGPDFYLCHHGIVPGLDGMHFYFPPLVEMVFLSGLLVKGPIVANLVHWEFGLLAAGAVFCLARRLFGGQIALLSAAIFLSTPSIAILQSKAYVDLALALYLTLTLWCFLEGFRSGQRSWLGLAAVFLGFAAGVKYTSIIGIVAIGAVVVFEMVRLPAKASDPGAVGGLLRWSGGFGRKGSTVPPPGGTPLRPSWRFLLVCSLIAVAVAAPWYAKNLAFTGNPVYPFLFGGKLWDSFQTEWISRSGSGLIGEPWRLVVAPLEMTILGIEGGEGYQATIGPLLLVLLPLLGLKNKRGGCRETVEGESPPSPFHPLPSTLIFCVVGYLAWLAIVANSALLQETRLLFPIFGALSAAAACAVYRLRPIGVFDLRRVVGAVIAIALALALTAQLTLFLADSPLPFIAGAETEGKYLGRHLGAYYDVAELVNGQLEEGAKVYSLWEPRTYYFQRPVQSDTLLDNWRHLRFKYGDNDAILRELRSQGYTHVLINLGGLQYFSEDSHQEVGPADLDALLDFEKRHLKLIDGSAVEAGLAQIAAGAGSGGVYSLNRLR